MRERGKEEGNRKFFAGFWRQTHSRLASGPSARGRGGPHREEPGFIAGPTSRVPPPKLPRRAGPPAVGPSSSSALVARARPYVRKDLTAGDGAVTGGMWLTGGVRWLAPCASAGRTRRVAFSGGGVGGSGRVQY